MKNFLFLCTVAAFFLIFDFFIVNNPDFSKSLFGRAPAEKIANPAAKYCLENGGERVVERDRSGNIFAFCRFTNGILCEEWAFYQGNCQATPASE